MPTESTQQLLIEIRERLKEATPEQIKWVFARLSSKTDKEAAKRVGVNNTSVSKWANKAQLDEIVRMLLIDPLVAAAETLRLAAPDAAAVLVGELRGKQKRAAANDVLDRAGIARLTKIAPVTPDGKEPYDSDTDGQRLALLNQLVASEQASRSRPDTDE